MINTFKPGDLVKLRHCNKAGFELLLENYNWILEEPSKPVLWDTFTVSEVDTRQGWITLKGLLYRHPFQKFTLV